MGSDEGHHHRWSSLLSDITEEENVSNSESSMSSPGDPHRNSMEDEVKDYDLSYDSDSIYLDMRHFRMEDYSAPPPPPKLKCYVSGQEVNKDYSGSIACSDESFKDHFSLMRLHDPLSDRSGVGNNVHVAVGNGRSSMDALFWTLTSNLVNPSTIIYVIHVFPETHFVPSPLGLLPKQSVSPEIVKKYEDQAKGKAKALLKKCMDACRSSFEIQNKVDAVLIENDSVEKTILKLIPLLKINTLVLGTGKLKTSSRMAKLRKNGIAHQVYINAPGICKVKLVCQGKEVMDPEFATPRSSSASSGSFDIGTSLSPSSSSSRGSSTSSSWFKRSKSYSDYPF